MQTMRRGGPPFAIRDRRGCAPAVDPVAAGGSDGTEFSAGAFFSLVEDVLEMRKMALFYCLFGRNDYFCKIGLG